MGEAGTARRDEKQTKTRAPYKHTIDGSGRALVEIPEAATTTATTTAATEATTSTTAATAATTSSKHLSLIGFLLLGCTTLFQLNVNMNEEGRCNVVWWGSQG